MIFKKPKFWDYEKISIWAILLLPFTLIYQIIFFINKKFKSYRNFSIPIICIGNIYIGGTGKTPLAREIFNIAKSLKKNPAFIKKSHDFLQDEVKMLEKTGKTFLDKKRSTGIFSLIQNNFDLAILDDGFRIFQLNLTFQFYVSILNN